jgi:hypothetical protein
MMHYLGVPKGSDDSGGAEGAGEEAGGGVSLSFEGGSAGEETGRAGGDGDWNVRTTGG